MIHTINMRKKDRDELSIPKDHEGMVALESWNVDGHIAMKAIPVKSIRNYILGLENNDDKRRN